MPPLPLTGERTLPDVPEENYWFRRHLVVYEWIAGRVELLGLFHARKLRVHGWALKAGWDSVHPRLGLTKPFYDRFTPAIAAGDFALRERDLDRALDFLAVCRT